MLPNAESSPKRGQNCVHWLAGNPMLPLTVASHVRSQTTHPECPEVFAMSCWSSLTQAPVNLTPGVPDLTNSGEPPRSTAAGIGFPTSSAAAVARVRSEPSDLRLTRQIRSSVPFHW